ncbi:MAG: P-loop NTPase fold protein, partial [Elusimicrobia bacterium]|nr:P-loop NTPase fold protein [Elusimicrobiota bacterium]
NKKNTFVVLLNAAQLEAEEDSDANINIHPKKIIENLIRRLYSASIDAKIGISNDLKKDIEKLYKKAVAKECSILVSIGKLEQQKDKNTVTREFKFISNIQNTIYYFGFIIAASILMLTVETKNLLLKLLPLIVASPLPFLVDAWFSYKMRKEKSEIKETKIKAEELYAFDNSIGNLEYDLEQIHRKFKIEKKKIVYVIDELDKLDAEKVIEVLKFFKNLFTLSDAIFIFVGGEEIYRYDKIKKQDDRIKGLSLYRPKEYTFFNSKYFLSRPLWDDLNAYFDEIVESKNKIGNTQELTELKRALAFEAKNDFFDLKTKIKDRIREFNEKGHPVIEIEDDDTKKAKLHKAVSVLFKKYMLSKPSAWEENEIIQRALFDLSHGLIAKNIGEKVLDPSDDSIQSAAIRDFNMFLYRLKMFNSDSFTQVPMRGVNITIRTYSILGEIPNEPPDNLDAPTEYENRFIQEFDRYLSYIITMYNLQTDLKDKPNIDDFWSNSKNYMEKFSSWGYNVSTLFDQNVKLYQELKQKAHQDKCGREQIEKNTEALSEGIKKLISAIPNVFGKFLTEWNKDLIYKKLNDDANLFGGAANKIRQLFGSKNPTVVTNKDNSRQILLIENEINTIRDNTSLIRDSSVTNKIISFSLNEELPEFDGYNSVITSDPSKMSSKLIKMLKYIDAFIKYKAEESILEIEEAIYGKNKSFNITKELNQRIVNGKLSAVISNDIAGDPEPNVTKTLNIKYKINGKTKSKEYPEGANVELP